MQAFKPSRNEAERDFREDYLYVQKDVAFYAPAEGFKSGPRPRLLVDPFVVVSHHIFKIPCADGDAFDTLA
jgi:hypothetical protein